MYSIYKKEINVFLSSLVGYLSVGVFLIATGLFVWVFPTYSVIHYGFAGLDSFFQISPYIFLFLIPAITMRMLSEEIQTGTFELLATRPLTDWQIILGKYFASLTLIALALLPTFVYYLSIYELGLPKGNIDTGAALGSYLGLFFLGAVFAAIGIFASSLSQNQIVAFLWALFLSAFCYDAFSNLSKLTVFFGTIDVLIEKIGINYHYISMSRGLIELRDLVYFLTIIIGFLLATKLKLEQRKW
jgi:ABC-2 type transport system permease protein